MNSLMRLNVKHKKRVVVRYDKECGRPIAIGQVQVRFLGIRYWSDLIEFDGPFSAAEWMAADSKDVYNIRYHG